MQEYESYHKTGLSLQTTFNLANNLNFWLNYMMERSSSDTNVLKTINLPKSITLE